MNTFTNEAETYIPEELQSIFKEYLGPNWFFHAEQELSARDNAYAFFDEFPNDTRDSQSLQVIVLLSELRSDIIIGRNIQSPITQNALYNWKPSFLIRDTLEKHPDWQLHGINQGGGACVVSVHNKEHTPYSGVLVPHDTIEERHASWSNAVKKLLDELEESDWVCLDCSKERIMSERVPDRPTLRRQNAEPIRFCHEDFEVFCPSCGCKNKMSVSFSS